MDACPILRGCHVLVVEDDYFIMDELRHGLERHGAIVIGPAGSVADALDLASAAPRIDVAVIDINLHGEMAFSVVEALRAREVPIVLATGYDREILPAADGRTIHCEKPVEPAAVARAVAACARLPVDAALPEVVPG